MAPAKPPTKKSTDATKTAPAKARRSSTKAASKPPKAVMKTTKTPLVSAPKEAPKGSEQEITKRDLVEQIMARNGMKKGEARHALEAVLAVLGEAISRGDSISAAPLGKLKVTRQKDTPNGKLAICRVKLKSMG